MAIFKSSHAQYKPMLLTSNWMVEIWVYIALYNAQLEISGMWKPEPQRITNDTIMDLATHSGLFTAPETRELTPCRIYLQLFFVSDLADVAGVHVEAWTTKLKEVSQGQASGSGRYNSGQ
jgi:hypothetical protein